MMTKTQSERELAVATQNEPRRTVATVTALRLRESCPADVGRGSPEPGRDEQTTQRLSVWPGSQW